MLTQHWARANALIHFSVMHPGWVDTPGTDPAPIGRIPGIRAGRRSVRALSDNHGSGLFQLQKNPRKLFISSDFSFAAVSKSMPQFHQMMGERLRRVEQGADTVVWLALSKAAARTHSGQFFQGQWLPFHCSILLTETGGGGGRNPVLARPHPRPGSQHV